MHHRQSTPVIVQTGRFHGGARSAGSQVRATSHSTDVMDNHSSVRAIIDAPLRSQHNLAVHTTTNMQQECIRTVAYSLCRARTALYGQRTDVCTRTSFYESQTFSLCARICGSCEYCSTPSRTCLPLSNYRYVTKQIYFEVFVYASREFVIFGRCTAFKDT